MSPRGATSAGPACASSTRAWQASCCARSRNSIRARSLRVSLHEPSSQPHSQSFSKGKKQVRKEREKIRSGVVARTSQNDGILSRKSEVKSSIWGTIDDFVSCLPLADLIHQADFCPREEGVFRAIARRGISSILARYSELAYLRSASPLHRLEPSLVPPPRSAPSAGALRS